MSNESHKTTMIKRIDAYRLYVIVALVIFSAIILLLSPKDIELGNKVKLVYLHSSLFWASLVMFAVSIIYFIVSIFTKNDNTFLSGFRLYITASVSLFIAGIISVTSMKVIWNYIAWQEDRFISLVISLFVLLIAISLASIFKNKVFTTTLYSFSALLVIYLWQTAKDVFHPPNAISLSNSAAIKLSTALLTVLLFIVGFLISRRK